MQTRHSGMGIAAFIVALLGGVLLFVMIAVAGVAESRTPGGLDEGSSTAVLIGLGIMAAVLMELVALGLGIGGVLQKDRQRIFAVLGLVFSIGAMLGTVGLMVLGLMS